MEDQRLWAFEESLWTGDADHYQSCVDDEVVMVLPQPPYVYRAQQAIDAVKDTPRWETVEFSEQQVSRPQEGLILIGYKAKATRGEENYEAYSTSTYRRLSHEDWRVVQHSQTPPLALSKG